ncbi:MAG: sigma-70 family RNA polymerase sigma factor [Bryobacterales bacterium]|nr:sigma-70 family RNA polymerase sigma factor [Bryobacterales bacterium]
MERFKESFAPEYFAEVFHRHRARVFLCCNALLRNSEAAADMTQETFMRAMNKAHTYHGGSLSAWLTTIARNQCINYMQALHRGPRPLDEFEDPPAPPNVAATPEVTLDLASRIAELPDAQRLCVQLFYLNGQSYEEIARLCGFTAKEVKSHLQNGIRRMRRSEAPS